MNDKVYEEFVSILKQEFPQDQAMRIAGMLYVAFNKVEGGEIPLNEDLTDFDKEHQLEIWADAFKICNSYQDALIYLREAELEPQEIEDGMKQVGQAQKDELFANFLIIRRASPKPVEKPQFIEEMKMPKADPDPDRVAEIEISEKDTISMKLHIEKYLKYALESKGAFMPIFDKKRVTVHKFTDLANYREFWLDREGNNPTYLFSEYMDAQGHKEGIVFVRQYLFQTKMNLKNREELLKQLRSNSNN